RRHRRFRISHFGFASPSIPLSPFLLSHSTPPLSTPSLLDLATDFLDQELGCASPLCGSLVLVVPEPVAGAFDEAVFERRLPERNRRDRGSEGLHQPPNEFRSSFGLDANLSADSASRNLKPLADPAGQLGGRGRLNREAVAADRMPQFGRRSQRHQPPGI